MRPLLPLLFVLLGCAPKHGSLEPTGAVSAEAERVMVQIVDEEGLAIPDVLLTWTTEDGDGARQVQTDGVGRAELPVEAGSRGRLVAERSGFQWTVFELTVPSEGWSGTLVLVPAEPICEYPVGGEEPLINFDTVTLGITLTRGRLDRGVR